MYSSNLKTNFSIFYNTRIKITYLLLNNIHLQKRYHIATLLYHLSFGNSNSFLLNYINIRIVSGLNMVHNGIINT